MADRLVRTRQWEIGYVPVCPFSAASRAACLVVGYPNAHAYREFATGSICPAIRAADWYVSVQQRDGSMCYTNFTDGRMGSMLAICGSATACSLCFTTISSTTTAKAYHEPLERALNFLRPHSTATNSLTRMPEAHFSRRGVEAGSRGARVSDQRHRHEFCDSGLGQVTDNMSRLPAILSSILDPLRGPRAELSYPLAGNIRPEAVTYELWFRLDQEPQSDGMPQFWLVTSNGRTLSCPPTREWAIIRTGRTSSPHRPAHGRLLPWAIRRRESSSVLWRKPFRGEPRYPAT